MKNANLQIILLIIFFVSCEKETKENKADLTIDIYIEEQRPHRYEIVNFGFVIKNIGILDADSSFLKIQIFDSIYPVIRIPTLLPNESFSIKKSAIQGYHSSITATVDINNEIDESDEGNNDKSFWYVLYVEFTKPFQLILNKDLSYGTMADIEGNVYKTIQIGNQEWMAQNLAVTKFNDGVEIPIVTDSLDWMSTKTPAYCWYLNDETKYKESYGPLYNYYTVETEKLCPSGWHVPSLEDWEEFDNYLAANGYNLDHHTGNTLAPSLISSGWLNTSEYWNNEVRNSTGFSALPAGYCRGYFNYVGYGAYWWSNSKYTESNNDLYAYSYSVWLPFTKTFIDGDNKNYGNSVRCVRD